MDRANQKGYRSDRGELQEVHGTGSGRTKRVGDFSVIVNLYIWKRRKNTVMMEYLKFSHMSKIQNVCTQKLHEFSALSLDFIFS